VFAWATISECVGGGGPLGVGKYSIALGEKVGGPVGHAAARLVAGAVLGRVGLFQLRAGTNATTAAWVVR